MNKVDLTTRAWFPDIGLASSGLPLIIKLMWVAMVTWMAHFAGVVQW